MSDESGKISLKWYIIGWFITANGIFIGIEIASTQSVEELARVLVWVFIFANALVFINAIRD